MGTLKGLASFDVHDVFIETGYGVGHTMRAMVNNHTGRFKELHSIEIDHLIAQKAQWYWEIHPEVTIHEGDSRDVLPTILDPDRSTTFWLDAHYAGGLYSEAEPAKHCTLMDELEIILDLQWQQPVTMLIDDVRIFNPHWWEDQSRYEPARDKLRREDWPTTEEVLTKLAPRTVDTGTMEDIWIVRF